MLERELHCQKAMSRNKQMCTLNLSSCIPVAPAAPACCPTRKRLAEAFDCLQRLDEQRAMGGDPRFGRFVEDRILWRELLELELQEIDEQIERLSAVVRTSAG